MAERSGDVGNGNGTKLLWWILGVCGSLVLLVAGIANSKLERIENRAGSMQVEIAQLQTRLIQMDDYAKIIRGEQLERTVKLAETSNRISLLEHTLRTLEGRSNTMSDRLLTINKRLDQRGIPVPPEIRME